MFSPNMRGRISPAKYDLMCFAWCYQSANCTIRVTMYSKGLESGIHMTNNPERQQIEADTHEGPLFTIPELYAIVWGC